MEETFNDMDDLIGKYLAGEASAREVAEVQTWAAASETNRKYLAQLRIIFDRAANIQNNLQFDEDQAWTKLKAKLELKKGNVVPMNPSRITRTLFYRIAASVIILVAVGIYFYRSTAPVHTVEVVAVNKGIGDVLPDGSDVFLNKQTKLTYQYDKKKKRRVVRLDGEAYFHVKHDEKREFLIDAAGVFVRDIGTTFTVKAYQESNTIEVVVKEGEVEFFAEEGHGIRLTASSKGVYNRTTKLFRTEQPESNALSFKTKHFTFSNQSLGGIVRDINSVYDKKLVISNNLVNCYLTVTFDNEDIDEIADVIAETLGLTVKRSGNEIILEGSGCEQ